MTAGGRRKLIVHVMESTAGGTRRHLDLLLSGLPRDRFALSAIVSDRGEEGFQQDVAKWRASGVHVHEVELARDIRLRPDWSGRRVLRDLFKALSPDVIHTHSSKAGFLGRLAAAACRRRGATAAVYHTPHIFPFQWAHGVTRSFYLRLERYAAVHCDAIVCLSKRQRDLAAELQVKRRERLVVIANGVDAAYYQVPSTAERAAARAELSLADEHLAVGMVGRLAPQKNIGQFIRAARLVADELPHARFFLVGSGPLEAEIRRRVSRLNLGEQFQLLGYREDTAQFMRALDLFVLTSLWEGLPYVILEAMATGLAVVATRIHGSVDLVEDGRTGRLADPFDDADVARHVIELLNDEDLRRRYGEAGRRRVEESFRLEPFLEAHVRLYEGTVFSSPDPKISR